MCIWRGDFKMAKKKTTAKASAKSMKGKKTEGMKCSCGSGKMKSNCCGGSGCGC